MPRMNDDSGPSPSDGGCIEPAAGPMDQSTAPLSSTPPIHPHPHISHQSTTDLKQTPARTSPTPPFLLDVPPSSESPLPARSIRLPGPPPSDVEAEGDERRWPPTRSGGVRSGMIFVFVVAAAAAAAAHAREQGSDVNVGPCSQARRVLLLLPVS